MLGKYTETNTNYIQNLFNEMTTDEKQQLNECDFYVLWEKLWGNHHVKYYAQNLSKIAAKFASVKNGIINTSGKICTNISTYIQQSTTAWKTPEWEFPKGRRNNSIETELGGALREFTEETGCPYSSINIVGNLLPFEETFVGSNYNIYKGAGRRNQSSN